MDVWYNISQIEIFTIALLTLFIFTGFSIICNLSIILKFYYFIYISLTPTIKILSGITNVSDVFREPSEYTPNAHKDLQIVNLILEMMHTIKKLDICCQPETLMILLLLYSLDINVQAPRKYSFWGDRETKNQT